MYAAQAELDDFSRVAQPQGLVASGFFANLLLSFDDALSVAIGTEIAPASCLRIRAGTSTTCGLVAVAPKSDGSSDDPSPDG